MISKQVGFICLRRHEQDLFLDLLYVFILFIHFGCAGSALLCTGFSLVAASGGF